MEIEIKDDTDNAFRFIISGVTNSYVNALRRTALNKISTFAIDRATFYENNSAMFDEYIAHRIGLIPILTPPKSSDDDEVLFSLEASGPCTVYSKELKTSDKEVRVANENIPIIKLAEGQRLRVEAKAVKGIAAKHAKFQPGLVAFEELDKNKFEVYVESFGQMPPKEIIYKSIEAIKNGLKEIKKEVKK